MDLPRSSDRDFADSATSASTRHRLLGTINGRESAALKPAAALDIESADAFRQVFTHMLSEGIAQFFIDLGDLDYIDSTGLGSLLQLYRETKARGGVVRLYNPTPAVQDIFTLTRLDRVLEIDKTQEAAFARARAE